MKSALKLFIAVLFILAAVRVVKTQEMINLSGKVRYADNHELVTQGYVKLFNSSGVEIGSTEITYQGDWTLWVIRYLRNQGDVIGIPDDEWELDFLPTGYPDQVDPAYFTHVSLEYSQSNIDIYVQRTSGQNRPGKLTTVTGKILSNNLAVKDAIVYAKQGDQFVGFGISDADGNYSIKNLPEGDYIIIVHKIASQSETRLVTANENSGRSVDFTLKSITDGNINTNPYEFALAQNYPNPFNPSTVISYSIANEGNVTLKVFNAAGQLVKELVNSYHTAGIYNTEFNASSLSSGVYFYRLETNGFTAVNKMILVK